MVLSKESSAQISFYAAGSLGLPFTHKSQKDKEIKVYRVQSVLSWKEVLFPSTPVVAMDSASPRLPSLAREPRSHLRGPKMRSRHGLNALKQDLLPTQHYQCFYL